MIGSEYAGQVPAMDSESAKMIVAQIRAKRESINSLVSRIEKVRTMQQRILQEREKAKTNQEAAERLHTIAKTALSILEKPPCSNFIFDNLGKASDG